MDARSEAALAPLMPEFAQKVRNAHKSFAAQTGSFFVVIQGLRTYAEQDALFAKGPSVTKARGGYSNHNFGMAVDVVPDADDTAPGLQPDWDTTHPHWKVLVRSMKAQGLQWGGDWKGMKGDLDHFQMAGVSATPTDADRAAFAHGGLPAVWAMYQNPPLDASTPPEMS